jgi:hypothetical protein
MRAHLIPFLFLSSCRFLTNQLGVATCEEPDGTFLVCGDGSKTICQASVELVVDCDGECTDDATGQGCAADLVCGDGFVKAGEECDNGEENSDTNPDSCRTDCTLSSCGDGVQDSSEACDDGVENSDSIADACRTDCSLSRCGDDTVDTGEACDDGDQITAQDLGLAAPSKKSGPLTYDTLSLQEIEQLTIKRALEATQGNRKDAAEKLGIGLRTLYDKLKLYDIR